MGFVLSAASLEWFLWLAAFLYCLVKVFIKAEHWTIRFLSVIMMIGFTLLRCTMPVIFRAANAYIVADAFFFL